MRNNTLKIKEVIIVGLSLAIATAYTLPGSAKLAANKSDRPQQKLANLPNGNYFYGTARSPYKSDTNYLVFRKTGNTITGMKYPVPGETTCFRGNVSGNEIKNVTIFLQPLGESNAAGQFVSRNSINLNSYYNLRFNQAPDFAKKGLPECIRIFSRKR